MSISEVMDVFMRSLIMSMFIVGPTVGLLLVYAAQKETELDAERKIPKNPEPAITDDNEYICDTCPNCQNIVDEAYNFCPICGQVLNWSPAGRRDGMDTIMIKPSLTPNQDYHIIFTDSKNEVLQHDDKEKIDD